MRLRPAPTLFPYTTLFRSILVPVEELTPPGLDAIARLAHTLLGERGIAGLEQHYDRDFAFEVTELARFRDRKSTRLNSSHTVISYAVLCLKKNIHTQGETL